MVLRAAVGQGASVPPRRPLEAPTVDLLSDDDDDLPEMILLAKWTPRPLLFFVMPPMSTANDLRWPAGVLVMARPLMDGSNKARVPALLSLSLCA